MQGKDFYYIELNQQIFRCLQIYVSLVMQLLPYVWSLAFRHYMSLLRLQRIICYAALISLPKEEKTPGHNR